MHSDLLMGVVFYCAFAPENNKKMLLYGKNTEVAVIQVSNEDYTCVTDLARL
jgi:hypothetical protein